MSELRCPGCHSVLPEQKDDSGDCPYCAVMKFAKEALEQAKDLVCSCCGGGEFTAWLEEKARGHKITEFNPGRSQYREWYIGEEKGPWLVNPTHEGKPT